MKLSRELKEFFSNPAFYIIAGIFLALSGYKFYSLIISYMNFMSIYPEHMFGGEISALLGISVNNFILPRLFEFYSYLILVAVPVLSTGIGYERSMGLDKIELMVSNVTELKFIIRKILSTTLLMLVILLPTLMYPMMLSLFSNVDYGIVASSYIGIILLTFISSCIVTPFGVLKMPIAVSIFLNVVILTLAYIYMIDGLFSSFLYGSIKISSILFVIISSVSIIWFSSKIYQSTRIFK
ncbi:MAG: hypothetical protein WCQ47_01985 [bacterium]